MPNPLHSTAAASRISRSIGSLAAVTDRSSQAAPVVERVGSSAQGAAVNFGKARTAEPVFHLVRAATEGVT